MEAHNEESTQQVFDITSDIRILFDGRCWTLQQKRQRTKRDSEETYYSWIDRGYYGRLREASDALLEEHLSPSERTDISQLTDSVKRGTQAIILALNSLESTCLETPKKIRRV